MELTALPLENHGAVLIINKMINGIFSCNREAIIRTRSKPWTRCGEAHPVLRHVPGGLQALVSAGSLCKLWSQTLVCGNIDQQLCRAVREETLPAKLTVELRVHMDNLHPTAQRWYNGEHWLNSQNQCCKWEKKVPVLSCIGKSLWHLRFLQWKTELGED